MQLSGYNAVKYIMKHLFFAGLVLLCTNAIAAPPTQLSLSDAIKKNMITVTAEANGNSYMEHGLMLRIKNNGSLTFMLTMNEGVIFAPDSSTYQPLILAGGEKLFMTALKEDDITVQTFCANSNNLAPVKGLKYSFSRVAGDTLVKILGYIKTNRLYNDMGQSAVWVFTNGHELNSVYDGSNDFVSKKLMDFIVANTGMKTPEYFVQSAINETPGEPVYTPKPLKIFAKYEVELNKPSVLTLGIYNDNNEMVQPVFENRRFGKAGHRFKVDFESENVPPGKYYIRLKDEENILRETMVEVN